METGKYAESIALFDESLMVDSGEEDIADAEPLLYRGLALKKAGKIGFRKDWEEAANRGSKRAAELLEQAAA